MIGFGVGLLLIYIQNCKSDIPANTSANIDPHYVCSSLSDTVHFFIGTVVSSDTVWSPNPQGMTVKRCEVMDGENYVDYEIPL